MKKNSGNIYKNLTSKIKSKLLNFYSLLKGDNTLIVIFMLKVAKNLQILKYIGKKTNFSIYNRLKICLYNK